MSIAEPSFYRLFERGRYGRHSMAWEDSDESTEHSERERYAVAAIGFCLKHDPNFRRHFLRQICGRAHRALVKLPKQLEIEVEPEQWADLRLTGTLPNGTRSVWVIEAKIDAGLAPKQNPALPKEFWRKGEGYGDFFNAAYSHSRIAKHYIVLGAREDLELGKTSASHGIALQQWHWDRLCQDWPRGNLTDDLWKALGLLGVGATQMKHAATLRVGHGLQQAVDAMAVLNAVANGLGIGSKRRRFECKPNTAGWEFGYSIHKPPTKKSSSKAHRLLHKATHADGRDLGWYGYGPDKQGRLQKSIWFYCGNKRARERLSTKLKKLKKFKAQSDDAPRCFSCFVDSEQSKKVETDLRWFRSVFETALGLKLGSL